MLFCPKVRSIRVFHCSLEYSERLRRGGAFISTSQEERSVLPHRVLNMRLNCPPVDDKLFRQQVELSEQVIDPDQPPHPPPPHPNKQSASYLVSVSIKVSGLITEEHRRMSYFILKMSILVVLSTDPTTKRICYASKTNFIRRIRCISPLGTAGGAITHMLSV